MKNIIFICTANKKPYGGNKIIYQYSNLIHSLKGYNSSIIHIKKNKLSKIITSVKKKFGLNKKRYTGWNFEDIMIENNFRENWFGINFINKDDFNFDPKNDLVVLPEIFAHFAETMLIKKKIPFVIFVQNGYSIFPTNDKSSLKLAYNKAKYILSYSKDIDRCVSLAYPKSAKKILRVKVAINIKKFRNNNKSNIITYMPRKLKWHSEQLLLFIESHLPKNWKIIPISQMTESEVFNNLDKSKIFLSFSSHEGLGLPPIEAAIAGNKVIGYTGEAGKEWWYKPIFSEIYSGDLQSFCKEILNFIKFKKNHQKIFSNQKKKLIKEFSEENQKKYILDFLKKI
tara:strand:+ start:1045 stop:2067 length:1023 start_codon:yes stop_codon:yes gene_type:complete